MSRETKTELERLAKKLGGGWRLENGVMPVVVLTIVEAQRLEKRLGEDVWIAVLPDLDDERSEGSSVVGVFSTEERALTAAQAEGPLSGFVRQAPFDTPFDWADKAKDALSE